MAIISKHAEEFFQQVGTVFGDEAHLLQIEIAETILSACYALTV